MKKCGYCGFENEDDAVACQQCGQQAFTEATTPTDTIKRHINLQKLMLRLLVAAAIWLIVSGIFDLRGMGRICGPAWSCDFRWAQHITQLQL